MDDYVPEVAEEVSKEVDDNSKKKPVHKPMHSSKCMAIYSAIGVTNPRYNEITNRFEINGGEQVTSARRAYLAMKVSDAGHGNIAVFERALWGRAFENRYNPISIFLHENAATYNGLDNFAELAKYIHDTYPVLQYGAETKTYSQVILQKWMRNAVGKALAVPPHFVQNFMPVLVGIQSAGKNYFARWMCRGFQPYFTESALDPDNKDMLIRLCENLVWHVDELGMLTRKKDLDSIKSFVMKEEVTVRRPYGMGDEKMPARASLIGSLNDDGCGFLVDTTGNKRFVAIRLQDAGGFDWNYSKHIDPNQLWAQAYHEVFDLGLTGELTREEVALRDYHNSDYQVVTPAELTLERLFGMDMSDDCKRIFTISSDILKEVGEQKGQHIGFADLAKVFKSHGCVADKAYVYGVQERGYYGVVSRKSSLVQSYNKAEGAAKDEVASSYETIVAARQPATSINDDVDF